MGDKSATDEMAKAMGSAWSRGAFRSVAAEVYQAALDADPLAAAEQGVIDAAVLARADRNSAHLLDLAVDELLHQRLRAARPGER